MAAAAFFWRIRKSWLHDGFGGSNAALPTQVVMEAAMAPSADESKSDGSTANIHIGSF